MAIEVGTRAGKYELVQQLGAGGFGVVFLARDHELGRDCALKFLLPQHTGNDNHVQRFLQEARAAAQIHHPGIVTVFECGQFPWTGSGIDGMVYIAMELLRGESLSARLKGGALPVAGAVAIARQIASAVGAAHQIGIVHRDLKPENVYLVPDRETVSGERVKVLDFGIAKLGEAGPASVVHTGAYAILGSPRYMSPEQGRSSSQVDARTDIYSLGVILFEMLCGERPFVDPDLGVLLANHQLVEPPRLSTRVAGLPDRLPAGSPEARLPAPQELRDHHRATIARRDAATLGAALAPAVYAMGPDGAELVYGASATRALIGKHIDRIPIGPRSAPIGHADGVAWWIEIGNDRQVASSTIAVAAGPEWRVAAWTLAYLVPNALAARLATANKLPAPAEIVRLSDPAAEAAPAAAAAFRMAMSSRAAFVEAFSTRDDAMATGTAPGELMLGGKLVRTTFARLPSALSLRGEIATGRITDRAAWAAANIDYTT